MNEKCHINRNETKQWSPETNGNKWNEDEAYPALVDIGRPIFFQFAPFDSHTSIAQEHIFAIGVRIPNAVLFTPTSLL